MRISIPTITGLANSPAYIQQIVASLEQLAKEVYVLTSKGMTLKSNVSYEIVQFKNEENTVRWIQRRHDLKREPIGVLWRKGDINSAKDIMFSERDVSIYLDAGASLTLVLM